MKAHGDIESVNLRTGERQQRVAGDGESRLESTISHRCVDCGTMTIGVHREPVTCENCYQKIRNAACDLEALADKTWREWADQREIETVWRRDRSGTPGNMAIDEACFKEGFKLGRS